MKDRAVTLLKAARDLLIKQKEVGILINYPLTVYYDEADCDGYCLLDDISAHLAVDGTEGYNQALRDAWIDPAVRLPDNEQDTFICDTDGSYHHGRYKAEYQAFDCDWYYIDLVHVSGWHPCGKLREDAYTDKKEVIQNGTPKDEAN